MQLTRPQILLVRGLLPSLALCACGGGSGGNSAPPAAAPPAAALAAPSVPAGLLASPENTQAGLTWTASAGAVSYHVKRSTTSGGPYKVIATPNAASYIDTGLVNGTIYYYVVSALDSAGESGNSTQEGVTPTLTLLAAAPGEVCPPPFRNDSSPTTVTVGNGTPASCTEDALAAAIAKGGVIRFSCGKAATIHLTTQLVLRTDVNTTLDGEEQITLDGGGTTRLFYYYHNNWQVSHTLITLQNLILQNGKASGAPLEPAAAPCSQGTHADGSGGVIYMRDGILRVWNTIFKNNEAATTGPDVAGGAIYALGSLGATIVGSKFQDNQASNGGAIGALFGDVSIFNSQFTSNRATGSGANYIDSDCIEGTNVGESGNGGNGGAVVIDGSEEYAVNVCGSTFTSNVGGSGANGGAIFRTPDGAMQTTTIDRSAFIGNTATKGGALYFHNSNLIIKASTLSGNTAGGGGGALFADGTTLTFTNDTFADNIAEKGLGGAIFLSRIGGSLLNVTFAGNTANGGPRNYGAAIGGDTALIINNTLFSDNTTLNCDAPMACAAGASTGVNDLQWPRTHKICGTLDSACTRVPGTQFEDPQLGALGDNGGPTQTVAPQPGSPAVGIGQNCPAADQRGVPRPLPPAGCTAGAVEVTVTP